MNSSFTHPTIGDLKKCLETEHGCVIVHEELFKNADTTIEKIYRTTKDGRKLFAIINDRNDAIASPSIVEYVLRRLELDVSDVHITNGDGERVSVKPTRADPGPPN